MADKNEYFFLYKKGRMSIEQSTPGRGKEYINIDRNQMMYQQMLSKLPQIKSNSKSNSKIEIKAEAVNLIEWN